MYSRALGFLMCLAAAIAVVAMTPPAGGPQQLVYIEQAQIQGGGRVGVFLPAIPVALGLQSKSGSKILAIGDVLNCRPVQDDETELFRKAANGILEPVNGHQQLLNCGPPRPGEPDRILAIIGIQWRAK